ncbi:DUF3703 domain-containing protein [Sphingomonas baiyangensis]|uniref:DUF3703 domain-containing protein n=2 Tax=Sphingomonas baiyangensis TaxID=2572576 RepID=A0A4U1L5P0_9SPHN|nr:DUF3703 domain-containing protein [Sphingomonas baiyangensis]
MANSPADPNLRRLVDAELERQRWAASVGDVGSAWWALERAHIVSQSDLFLHLRVHGIMLMYGLRTADLREAAGQLLRLALAPLGTLSGRTPVGNTGRARVDPFAPMPVPGDLRRALEEAGG